MSLARFTQLYLEVDATTRTAEKVAALERYFREADPGDAAWALYFLTGRRLKRVVSSTELWDLGVEVSGLPGWLLEECHAAVGDFSETLALVLPPPASPRDLPLREAVTQRLDAMRRSSVEGRKAILRATWDELSGEQRFVFHKLISGSFRVGVSKLLTLRGAARAAGLEAHELAHRTMGDWAPTAETFRRLTAPVSGDAHAEPGSDADRAEPSDPAALLRPYPFYLAHQLQEPPDVLGPSDAWQVEWKWDGTRCQMIRRGGAGAARCALWSRGEELVSEQFPELLAAASGLPPGTVLDGEVLAWDLSRPMPEAGGRPLGFAALQRRLNRKAAPHVLFHDVPVIFLAYDLLEDEGRDVRGHPLRERRAMLERVLHDAHASGERLLRLSPIVRAPSWEEYAALRAQSRGRGVEGLMLKPVDSLYGVGRTKGGAARERAGAARTVEDEGVGVEDEARERDADGPRAPRVGPAGGWWKWKIDPYTIDAVLIYAQRGSGRRASLYTDYTFGVWDRDPAEDGASLVPIAKAYSGLSDEEIDRVDRFVRTHAIGKRGGAFRAVEPTLVFELAFEGLQRSDRHKAGIALRFPRMARWRTDKPAREADTLERVRALLEQSERADRGVGA